MNDGDRRRWFQVGIAGVLVLVLAATAAAPIIAGASGPGDSSAFETLAGTGDAHGALQANETETNATTTAEVERKATERKAGETTAAERTTASATAGTSTVTPAYEEDWQIDPTLNESQMRNMTKEELIDRILSLQRTMNSSEAQYLERIHELERELDRTGANASNATTPTNVSQVPTETETANATTEASATATTTGGNATNATVIRLNGAVPGWKGTAPGSIEGTTNPTLNLTPGQKYTVVWKNVDGEPHNFVIRDSNGEQLLRTEIMATKGETQSVTFTATPEMATYLCEVHPSSMVGDVSTGSNGSTQGNTTTANASVGTAAAINP